MIKPLNNNVVLKKEKKETKTQSGIILSEKEEDTEYAVVYAIGKGRIENGTLHPIDLKVGDKVIYKTYSPTKVKVNDEDFLIINADDVLAVLN